MYSIKHLNTSIEVVDMGYGTFLQMYWYCVFNKTLCSWLPSCYKNSFPKSFIIGHIVYTFLTLFCQLHLCFRVHLCISAYTQGVYRNQIHIGVRGIHICISNVSCFPRAREWRNAYVPNFHIVWCDYDT